MFQSMQVVLKQWNFSVGEKIETVYSGEPPLRFGKRTNFAQLFLMKASINFERFFKSNSRLHYNMMKSWWFVRVPTLTACNVNMKLLNTLLVAPRALTCHQHCQYTPEAQLRFNMANKAGKWDNSTLSAFTKNDLDFAILINVKLTPQNYHF